MKKITITNAYTWYNKGDAGILLGTVETIKNIYNNDIEIEVLSFTPEEDKKRYCNDPVIKNVYSNVLNPHPYKHTKMGKIIAIIKLFFSMIYQFIAINCFKNRLAKKSDNYKSLSQADYIIICGGGFLGGKKIDSFMHLFQIYVNTKFNKKVIMMGTSIEPINNRLVKIITESTLKKVDFIFARELITYDYLKEFLSENKFELIPDMAFMLDDVKEKLPNIENLKKQFNYIYGITVRKWNFPEEKNGKELFEKYKNEIAKFIEYKASFDNSLFVFVPQVIVEYGNDSDVAKDIKSLLSEEAKKHFIILEDDIHPNEIKQLIWNFDFFIGTRMHSNIFATSMGVPTIAIAYEKKTNGIMHTVQLDDYVIEMKNIDFENLKLLSEKQINNKEQIKKDLELKINDIRQEILNKIVDKIPKDSEIEMLFVHDHKLRKFKDDYYTTGGFSDSVTDRYTSVFNKMVLLCRAVISEDIVGCSKIENQNLTVCPIYDNKLLPKDSTLKIIEQQIENTDRVIVRMPSVLGIYASRIAFKKDKKLMVEVVGSAFGSYWFKSLFGKIVSIPLELINKHIIRKADYVLYVTENYLQNEYPNNKKSLGCSDVVLEPRDQHVFDNRLKKIRNFQGNEKIILGTLSQIDQKYKGHKDVFKAISNLKKQGKKIEYRLAGSGNKNYLKSLAQKYDIEDCIIFCGQINHKYINAWIDELDIYIQPSLTEGMPRSVIEAIYRGCPTIVSSAGGMYELIEEQFTFKRGNSKDLTNILKSIDRNDLIQMSKRNFEFSEKFNLANILSKRKTFLESFKKGE